MGKENKKKKKSINLEIFKTIKRTFKYYLKNSFFILIFNVGFFVLFTLFFRNSYDKIVAGMFGTTSNKFFIAYYFLLAILLYSFKSVFFINILNNQINGAKGGFFESSSLAFKRFLPAVIACVFWLLTSAFFSLFLGVPGFFAFFYFSFCIILHGFGDISEQSNCNVEPVKIDKMFSKSYKIIKGSFLRYTILILMFCIVGYFFHQYFLDYIKSTKQSLGKTATEIIIFSFYDIILICQGIIFIDLINIEVEKKEAKAQAELEEKVLLQRAATNSSKKK